MHGFREQEMYDGGTLAAEEGIPLDVLRSQLWPYDCRAPLAVHSCGSLLHPMPACQFRLSGTMLFIRGSLVASYYASELLFPLGVAECDCSA